MPFAVQQTNYCPNQQAKQMIPYPKPIHPIQPHLSKFLLSDLYHLKIINILNIIYNMKTDISNNNNDANAISNLV